MTSNGYGFANRVAATGGGTQPAGDRGGSSDRGVRDLRAVRAVDRTAGPGAPRFGGAVDDAVVIALVRNRRTGARHFFAHHLWRAHFDAGRHVRGGCIAEPGADSWFDGRLLR